jgi:hypothetical protein
MSTSKQTHDHKQIQNWAEEREGLPAVVKDTSSGSGGVLRIHFPEQSDSGDDLKVIGWDEFFKVFDDNKLEFLYQEEKSSGEKSTFHKFINRS